MLLDSTFLIDLENERRARKPGRADAFLQKHANQVMEVPVIAAGEFLAGCSNVEAGLLYLSRWSILELPAGLAVIAAKIERAQRKRGRALGENDNWLVAFALSRRAALVSRDHALAGIPGLRVQRY